MSAGVAELDVSACWGLLRSTVLGRVAFLVDGHVEVRPVNYAVDRGTICYRTNKESLLSRCVGQDVAFEVDGADQDGTAWSVLVRGPAAFPSDVEEIVGTLDVPVFPWHPSPKPFFVRIDPTEVTGRSFHIADPSTWFWSLSQNRAEPPGEPERA